MRHAFDIPELTKSHFGKNQSYEVLFPDRRYNSVLTKLKGSILHSQGFFLVSSGAEIRPLSQWDLGDFFPNLKKFFFFLEFSNTHTQAT